MLQAESDASSEMSDNALQNLVSRLVGGSDLEHDDEDRLSTSQVPVDNYAIYASVSSISLDYRLLCPK